MSQTSIRTFLIASAAFLALEAAPVVASLAVRQTGSTRESVQRVDEPALARTWMPGHLFDVSTSYRSRRDVDD
ncbi:hypothetical protein [Pararobbsia silviterrae]|uniref:Uncharacterized protein n=1 Tax=Pararobbsia silviterrae TaxID=1792498 RepID=A0A494X7U6_9BURK|nr:hypothetical protein [Pararobbsia silviterrae]RKP44069.1 hypothetical protein D7S86_28035 [Pararobbsia silviterrae]